MKKILRRTGNSIGVWFNKEEQQTYNIEVGDVLDLSDIVVIKSKKKKKQ